MVKKLEGKTFKRVLEDFKCGVCDFFVKGSGYTNHCPKCLHSKHVDLNPGDRESNCQGIMVPKVVGKAKKGWFIVHQCAKCGIKKKNKVSEEDDQSEILKYIGHPY